MNIQLSKLSNGIRVVTCEMPHAQSATFGIWAAVGGRHEPARLTGISHFIEHMLFKGTRRRTARQIGQEVEAVGGYLNATTTHDHTVYYGAAPADHFNRLSAVLCDMVLEPRFAATDIRRERAVIAEEIQMYHDEPSELVQELLWEELWPDHALGRPLTGTLESIAALRRDDLLAYRATHYQAGNTVVSAAGRMRHGDVLARVERLLGALPRGRRSRASAPPELTRGPRIRVIERETQQVHVAFAVPCCAMHNEDRYATTLLNVLLGGNVSSRLFQELREKRGLCYSVSSNLSQYEDAGVLNFYIGLDAKNLEKALRLLCREFKKLRDEPVRAAELKRAKEYAIGSSRMALERTSAQNSRIGASTLFHGRVLDAEDVHARLRATDAGELQRVAGGSLRPQRMTMTVIGAIPEATPIATWLE
ncbi:MAG: pitrilysin family protein [Terrimicrobiaceae bacterium]|nr:pitrilysin family protein [Terrimicrobiaceae bacterium]